jgi:hypothetical protein
MSPTEAEVVKEAVRLIRKFPRSDRVRREQLAIIENIAREWGLESLPRRRTTSKRKTK